MRLVKEISPLQREWRNTPEIMSCTRGSELLSEEDQRVWQESLRGDKSRIFFGLEVVEKSNVPGLKKRPVLVGTAGLTSISYIHRTAEWSLLIGPGYQGKGYAKQGLKLLLEYGFLNLGMNRIWGEIFEYNEASKHLAEINGFRVEGICRQSYFKQGKYIDSVIVGLLREDWQRLQHS